MAFLEHGLSDLCHWSQWIIRSVTRELLQRHSHDIERVAGTAHLRTLTEAADNGFVEITFSEAVTRVLKRAGPVDADLSREDELALVKALGNRPVLVTRYPKSLKPFYMQPSDPAHSPGLQTVECVDVRVPGVGEILGGSVRQCDPVALERDMSAAGLLPGLQWYLDLRTLGMPRHGGFGIGVERLVQWMCRAGNIRDVQLLARAPGHFPM